jgi:hypothetical protein
MLVYECFRRESDILKRPANIYIKIIVPKGDTKETHKSDVSMLYELLFYI